MLKRLDETERRAAKKVAVIGSGIAGMSAAWLLSRSFEVTLFEEAGRPGGHSNTVEADAGNGRVAVDTGFIVYNERNYPNLVALFKHLNVPTDASDMSFSASLEDGGFEYSGSNIWTMLGQRSNVVSLRFWSMLRDILRFYREAESMKEDTWPEDVTLGDFLDHRGYSKAFVNDHILPMGAAIWSTTAPEMRDYPLMAFIRFFQNHGLVSLKNRPVWRTVKGGSREYVRRLLDDFQGDIRLASPVQSVERTVGGVLVRVAGAHAEFFDEVVIASHANQALAMRVDADADETNILSAFSYTKNVAVLHSDVSLMPRRKSVWASWNYIESANAGADDQLCVTYWMNRLQNLDPKVPLFVTLNPGRRISDRHIREVFEYEHPLFDRAAMQAQKDIWSIQGRGGIWYCGAHLGSGFHEDGLQAGLAVAEALGGERRPWKVENESGRIHARKSILAAE